MRWLTIVMPFIFATSVAAQTGERALLDVESFAFTLGLEEEEIRAQGITLMNYDLVVVDGELISAQTVSDLQAGGSTVLAYLSIGTIERWRSWYRRVKRFRLDLWGDWGEWYANVNRRRFRKVITKKVLPKFLDKGFDGIFLDNVDMVSSHRKQRRGMRKLVTQISEIVHERSALLFAQNGDSKMYEYAPLLDGWNREDVTSTYDFDRESYVEVSEEDTASALEAIAFFKQAGLLVTTTDYIDEANTSLTATAVQRSCSAGAVPTVSDIELTRIPQQPLVCGSL